MFRKVSILLWLLVIAGICYLVADRLRPRPSAITKDSGQLFSMLPWKHLPDVAAFELTDSGGSAFGSSRLAGHPYAVNFFYSTCPSICRRFNEQVRHLAEQFRGEDLTFLSITVDPETDTPDRLAKYATLFEANPDQWRFLTGPMSDIRNFAAQSFRVTLEKETHTESIFLVDRWGRFRDQFRWDDPEDMKRFAKIAKQVIEEQEPPLKEFVTTRNLMAGTPHTVNSSPPWLNEFYLQTTEEKTLFSRDLIGEVWIGSIFFSTCTTHCIEQNRYLRDLQSRLGDRPVRIVSVTTDPQTDTPERLRQYALELQAVPFRWIFLTGDDKTYLHRVSAEFLGLFVQGSDHATDLAVVDRWGKVRQKFNWRKPEQEAAMFKLIDELLAETRPPLPAPTGSSEIETNPPEN